MKLRIHYYDPEMKTGPAPDDKGAWRLLIAALEGDGLPRQGELPSVLEERRTAWVHRLFPETVGKVMVTRVAYEATDTQTGG